MRVNIQLTKDEVKIIETILYLSLIDTRMHLDEDAKKLVKHALNTIANTKESVNE